MKMYPYDRGKLLDEPNTYFYTPYLGAKFLNLWKRRREDVRELLNRQLEPPKRKSPCSLRDLSKKINNKETIETYILFESLYACLCKDGLRHRKHPQPFVDKVVKKFETTKRIHETYGPGFRARDKDAYRNLPLYVRAAEIFESAYTHFKALPYLNALLKCIDTLSSLNRDLDGDSKGRLDWLIMRERNHVDRLAKSIGVSI